MKKRIAAVLLFIFLWNIPVFAAEQRIFDNADLLSEAEEAEMAAWVEEIQEKWGLDLAYVTTNDTEEKSVREYGADFYIAENLGLGETQDGVIFVLDMGQREGQILTHGKAIEIYTDYYIDEMWDNMAGYLSDGAYYEAFYSLYEDIDAIAGEYEAYQAEPDSYLSSYQKEQRKEKTLGGLCIAAAFSLAAAGIAVFVMRRGSKNIRPYTDGRAYLKENGVTYTTNRDSFVGTHTAMVPIPKDDDHNNTHSGGFGGSSSTFSHGGRSFGGGGGKF